MLESRLEISIEILSCLRVHSLKETKQVTYPKSRHRDQPTKCLLTTQSPPLPLTVLLGLVSCHRCLSPRCLAHPCLSQLLRSQPFTLTRLQHTRSSSQASPVIKTPNFSTTSEPSNQSSPKLASSQRLSWKSKTFHPKSLLQFPSSRPSRR